MSDPIAPPAARWPSEAAELVALAVSDGDLGAAVAQYESAAALLPWAGDGRASADSWASLDAWASQEARSRDDRESQDVLAGQDSRESQAAGENQNGHKGGTAAGPADDGGDARRIAETMAAIMRLRLPLDVRLIAVLPAAGLTMLVCERHIAGQGPDGRPVSLHGVGCTVVRPQDDGSWRIAADAWQLADSSGA